MPPGGGRRDRACHTGETRGGGEKGGAVATVPDPTGPTPPSGGRGGHGQTRVDGVEADVEVAEVLDPVGPTSPGGEDVTTPDPHTSNGIPVTGKRFGHW